MPRFSANLGFLWPDRPLLDRIRAAAAAGFKAIELHWPYDTPAEDIRVACTREGLAVLGLNTPLGDTDNGEFGLGALPGREEEFQAGLDLSLTYARAIGANAVHAMAGVIPPEQRAICIDTLVANLAQAARKADGLTLLLEPINLRDKPGYLYSRVSDAVTIIERVGAANIRLMFDVYHVGVSEGDITRKLAKHLPVIGHIQIAAVPSRAEPDEGEINYAAIFATLDAIGYGGWVGCEYRPRGDTDEGLAWLSRLGTSLRRE
ncbi:MAG: hydroxypyruvate isomerase family protein [Propylenella sp.]